MEYIRVIPLSETEVDEIIPHRRPFRFIESVLEVEFGRRAVAMMSDLSQPGYKWIEAHFPSFHVVPGAIILEALAEVGAVAVLGLPQNRNKIAMLTGADQIRWRKEVIPGQPLRLETEITNLRSNFGRGYGKAILNGDVLAAEGSISFFIVPKPPQTQR